MSGMLAIVLGVAVAAVVLVVVVGVVALLASRGERLEVDEAAEVFGPAPDQPTEVGGLGRL
jgi:hypothetical protein